MISNLWGYSCSRGFFSSAGMLYYMLQNDIGSYVPVVSIHVINSGDNSCEPSQRKFATGSQ